MRCEEKDKRARQDERVYSFVPSSAVAAAACVLVLPQKHGVRYSRLLGAHISRVFSSSEERERETLNATFNHRADLVDCRAAVRFVGRISLVGTHMRISHL